MLAAVNVRDAPTQVPVPDAHAGAPLTNALTGEAVEGDSLSL